MSELDHAKVLAAANLLEPDSQTSLPIAIRKLEDTILQATALSAQLASSLTTRT
jgi:hypothetical protein